MNNFLNDFYIQIKVQALMYAFCRIRLFLRLFQLGGFIAIRPGAFLDQHRIISLRKLRKEYYLHFFPELTE